MRKLIILLLFINIASAQYNLFAWQNFAYKITSTIDADAAAFLTASGIPNDGTLYYVGTAQEITGEDMNTAIGNLVANLKLYGIWTHIKAFYPFIGGTASTHKYNLKNPIDSDAAFRLVFTNTPTQSGLGMQTNGSSSYANTFLNPSTVFSDKATAFGFYQTVINTTAGTDRHFMGNWTSSSTNFMSIQSQEIGYTVLNFLNNVNIQTLFNYEKFNTENSNTTTKSLTCGTTSYSYTTITGNFPNNNIFIGGLNTAGTYYQGVNSTFGAAWIMNGLTDTQIGQLNALVTAYQTELHRN